MTWSTTHLGISSIVLYTLSPKDLKEELRNDPKLFFVLSLGAIAPDFDLFTGLHRSLFHSVFWPLLLILIAPLLARKWPESNNLDRNVKLLAFMCLTHMLFDLTFGSIALFWPIDKRFYDVTMGIRIGLEGWSIFPVTIKGLFISIDHVSQKVGTDTFFVNWTSEKRIEVFQATFLDIPVSQFTVHATIFLWYVFMVLIPYFKYRREVRAATRVTSPAKFINLPIRKKIRFIITSPIFVFMMVAYIISDLSVSIYRNTKSGLLPIKTDWTKEIALILIMIGSLYAGPIQGQTWKEQQNYQDVYWVLTDGMQLNGQRTFKVPDGSELNIKVEFEQNPIAYQAFVMEASLDSAGSIANDTNDLIQLLNDGKITSLNLIQDYQQNISRFVPLIHSQIIDENTTANWEFTSSDDITLVFGLYSWNSSEFFVKASNTEANWVILRDDAYQRGFIVFIVSLILFIVDLISIKRINKK